VGQTALRLEAVEAAVLPLLAPPTHHPVVVVLAVEASRRPYQARQ
jgi:hypothetical protein